MTRLARMRGGAYDKEQNPPHHSTPPPLRSHSRRPPAQDNEAVAALLRHDGGRAILPRAHVPPPRIGCAAHHHLQALGRQALHKVREDGSVSKRCYKHACYWTLRTNSRW